MRIISSILLLSVCYGVVINVPADYSTIQAGIDASFNGDTVFVSNGTYYEELLIDHKYISLLGENRETTIIDGDSTKIGIYIPSSKDSIITVSGFTIQNCSQGMLCVGGNPHIYDIIIQNCAFQGGIACNLSTGAHIKNVIIKDNLGIGTGGGMNFNSSQHVTLEKVSFINNSAQYWGGAIWSYNSSLHLINVTVSENSAYVCGAIYNRQSNIYIINSIIWNNWSLLSHLTPPPSPSNLGSICLYNDNYNGSSTFYFAYSNIEGIEGLGVNSPYPYSYWLDGNIEIEPLFVDPQNQNFTLQSNSPCINAGIDSLYIEPEEFIDENGNGYYDYSEAGDGYPYWEEFIDENGNGLWDSGIYLNIPAENYIGSAPDMGAYEYEPPMVVEETSLPIHYRLNSTYPNPFNPTTTISFSIPEFGFTTITAYDITGRLLETLTNEVLSIGNYSINWNASSYPSGVYLIRMDSGDFTQTQKVVLVK